MRRFNRNLGVVFLCAGSILCGAESNNPSAKVPYDDDLYNKDKSVFFFTGDFLYWLVNESVVDYAIKMDHKPWSTTESTAALGNFHNAKFNWSPGFRIGFGHFNAPHYWDVFVQYTYLPAYGENKVHAPKDSDKFLNGTWIQPSAGTGNPPAPLKRAESRIDLRYHVFDLLFTRRFHTNEHLRFNVFGGVTSAFIYQKWDIRYKDINRVHSHLRNRWQFDGAGLRAGVKLDWYMGEADLYITGLASTAILSGWYKNSAFQKTSVKVADANNSRPIHDSHFHDSRLVYTAQFMAGPSWQKRFKCIRTEVIAGYEFNIWTNLHETYRSSFNAPTATKETFINNSHLSLQGFTVRVNVDF